MRVHRTDRRTGGGEVCPIGQGMVRDEHAVRVSPMGNSGHVFFLGHFVFAVNEKKEESRSTYYLTFDGPLSGFPAARLFSRVCALASVGLALPVRVWAPGACLPGKGATALIEGDENPRRTAFIATAEKVCTSAAQLAASE